MAFPYESDGLDGPSWEELNVKRKDILSKPIPFEQDLDDPLFRDSCLKEPIIILKNFLQHRNFSGSDFRFGPDDLRAHGSNRVPIVHQSADVTGWKGLHTPHYHCTLREYVSYVQFFKDFLGLMAYFCVDLVPCTLDKSLVYLKSLNEPVPPFSSIISTISSSLTGVIVDMNRHLLILPLRSITYDMALCGSSNMIKVTHALAMAYTDMLDKKNTRTRNNVRFRSGENIINYNLPSALKGAYVSFAGISESDFIAINCLRLKIQKIKGRPQKDGPLALSFHAHADILSSNDLPFSNGHSYKADRISSAEKGKDDQLSLQLFRWKGDLCLQVVFFGTVLLYHPISTSHGCCEEVVIHSLRQWLWDEEKGRLTGAFLREFVFLQGNSSEIFLKTAVRNFVDCVDVRKEPVKRKRDPSDTENCSSRDKVDYTNSRSPSGPLPYTERSDSNGRLRLSDMIDYLKSGDVFFCSNVSIGGWAKEVEMLRSRFPGWMMCSSSDDMLKRLRQNVDGMNTPQLYVKCPGVWTAGHQENCNLYSINCNSGPDDSEWFCVEKCRVDELRQKVLEREKVDILREEGWFPRCEWLCEMDIPFLHGVQKAGDAVLLKGDTLHWVRSLGFCSQFSWNFGPMRREQVESIFQRVCVNEQMTVEGPAFQSLVPVLTLLLDIVKEVCQEGRRLGFILEENGVARVINMSAFCAQCPMAVCLQDKDLVLMIVRELVRGARTLREGLARCEKIIRRACQLEPNERMVVFCEERTCKREIFEAYVDCDRCGYICLTCFERLCGAKGHCNATVFRKRGSPMESEVIDQLVQIVISVHVEDPAFVTKLIAEKNSVLL